MNVEVLLALIPIAGWWGLLIWLARRKIALLADIAQRLDGSSWSKGVWTGVGFQAGASGAYQGRKVEISTSEAPKIAPRTRIELTYKDWTAVGHLSDVQIADASRRLDSQVPPELKAIGGHFYLNKNLAGWTAPIPVPELDVAFDLLSHIDFRATELEKIAKSADKGNVARA